MKRESNLLDRLEGIYRIPITDGMGPAGGDEPDNPKEFVRRFEVPPIQKEAAAEIGRLRAEIEELQAKYDRACDALQPFAEKPLYPDDFNPTVREDEDWDEAKNEEEFEDLFIKRAWIRRAREVVREAKS